MRLALPDVARSPHASVPCGLGEGAFNAATRLIHVVEFGCLLTGSSGQEQLVALGRKADRHAPPGRLRLGVLRLGALCPQWTGLAGGLSKPDRDDGLAFGILPEIPGDALLALWTRHDAVLPVDVEVGDIEGSRGVRLPTRVDVHRSDELNGMSVTALQNAFGTDVPRIDQVLLRQEVLAC